MNNRQAKDKNFIYFNEDGSCSPRKDPRIECVAELRAGNKRTRRFRLNFWKGLRIMARLDFSIIKQISGQSIINYYQLQRHFMAVMVYYVFLFFYHCSCFSLCTGYDLKFLLRYKVNGRNKNSFDHLNNRTFEKWAPNKRKAGAARVIFMKQLNMSLRRSVKLCILKGEKRN